MSSQGRFGRFGRFGGSGRLGGSGRAGPGGSVVRSGLRSGRGGGGEAAGGGSTGPWHSPMSGRSGSGRTGRGGTGRGGTGSGRTGSGSFIQTGRTIPFVSGRGMRGSQDGSGQVEIGIRDIAEVAADGVGVAYISGVAFDALPAIGAGQNIFEESSSNSGESLPDWTSANVPDLSAGVGEGKGGRCSEEVVEGGGAHRAGEGGGEDGGTHGTVEGGGEDGGEDGVAHGTVEGGGEGGGEAGLALAGESQGQDDGNESDDDEFSDIVVIDEKPQGTPVFPGGVCRGEHYANSPSPDIYKYGGGTTTGGIHVAQSDGSPYQMPTSYEDRGAEIRRLIDMHSKAKARSELMERQHRLEINRRDKALQEVRKIFPFQSDTAMLSALRSNFRDDPHPSMARCLDFLMRANYTRSHYSTKAVHLANALMDEHLFMGEARRAMVVAVIGYLRRTDYTPRRVLKQLDCLGGGFLISQTGVDSLRHLCTNGLQRMTLLPSSSAISNVARRVEETAVRYLPYKLLVDGEGYQFDIKMMLQYLIRAFGLQEKAKTEDGIEIFVSGDAAQLCNNATHVTLCIRMTDPDCLHPVTGERLDFHTIESNIQSRDWCFPIRSEVRADDKEGINRIRPILASFLDRRMWTELSIKFLKVIFGGDLKWIWSVIQRGGGAKRHTNFCIDCPLTSAEIHLPRRKPCRQCKDAHHSACYHHDTYYDEDVDTMKVKAANLRVPISSYLDAAESEAAFFGKAKINLPAPGQVNDGMDDVKCINYQPHLQEEFVAFSNKLDSELALRSMDLRGDLRARRIRLKKALKQELAYKEAVALSVHMTLPPNSPYGNKKSVYCLLHMEMRIGIKINQEILKRGLSLAYQGELVAVNALNPNGTGLQKQDTYLSMMENFINSHAFGSEDQPATYRIQTVSDTATGGPKKLAPMNFNKIRVRKLLNNIAHIIELSNAEPTPVSQPQQLEYDDEITVEPPSAAQRLIAGIEAYKKAWVILRMHTDYHPDDLLDFQEHIDVWYRAFIQEFGRDFCTNYVHLLSCGHILEQMTEFGNLYRYSQEGLEAMNALMKSYFFRRTRRGGGPTSPNNERNRVHAIARWLSRRLLWVTGDADRALLEAYGDQDDRLLPFDAIRRSNEPLPPSTDFNEDEDSVVVPFLDDDELSQGTDATVAETVDDADNNEGVTCELMTYEADSNDDVVLYDL